MNLKERKKKVFMVEISLTVLLAVLLQINNKYVPEYLQWVAVVHFGILIGVASSTAKSYLGLLYCERCGNDE